MRPHFAAGLLAEFRHDAIDASCCEPPLVRRLFRRGPSVRKSGPGAVPQARSQAVMVSWVVAGRLSTSFSARPFPDTQQCPSVQFQVRHVELTDF